MKRLLIAAATFALVALFANAEAMHRTAEVYEPRPVAAVIDAVSPVAEQAGTGMLREATSRLAVALGAGVAQLDVVGDGDVYLFAGDSLMADIAPLLTAEVDRRSNGASIAYEMTRKGSKAGNDLWGWETDLPAEVRRVEADIVMLVLDVDASSGDEYEYRAGVLVDSVIAAGARHVVWIEHPVSAVVSFEQDRAMRHSALTRLAASRSDLTVIDPSPALINASGGFTTYLVTGTGAVLRVREDDGFHLTEAGAARAATEIAARLGL